MEQLGHRRLVAAVLCSSGMLQTRLQGASVQTGSPDQTGVSELLNVLWWFWECPSPSVLRLRIVVSSDAVPRGGHVAVQAENCPLPIAH